jgi:hypothetical protein
MFKYLIQCVKEAKCEHQWELFRQTNWSDDWGGTWKVWTYVCKKCCATKKVNNK